MNPPGRRLALVVDYTVYVGGPMTDRPFFNFPAFDSCSLHCRTVRGWHVFNPHEHDRAIYPGIDAAEATRIGDVRGLVDEIGFSFADAMTWDLARVLEADGIVLLPEWEKSTGARHERYVAEVTGKDVWLAEPVAIDASPFGSPRGTTIVYDWSITLDPIRVRVTHKPVEVLQ